MKKIAVLLFSFALLAASCTKQVSAPETNQPEIFYIRVQADSSTDYSPVAFTKL